MNTGFRSKMIPNTSLPFILAIIMILMTSSTVTGQFIEPQLCGKLCLCYSSGEMVDCSRNDKIRGIPNNIKSIYSRLSIQYGQFNDRAIGPRNFTTLSHLTELKIIYCRIRTIEPYTFRGMTKLRLLDLSYNDLGVVVPYTFTGLNLRVMHLQQNPNVALLPGSFAGMNTTALHLRSNNIHYLQYETFANIRLSKLFLYNNSIRELDRRFGQLFNSHDKFIDLTANPLHCTCQISWIVRFIKSWLTDSAAYRSVNTTCGSPMSFVGRELRSIELRQLPCPRPRIKAISLDIRAAGGTAQLVCTAAGSQAPRVSWSYIESNGNRNEHRRSPPPLSARGMNPRSSIYNPGGFRGAGYGGATSEELKQVETSNSMNVTLISTEARVYNCTAWNEDDVSEERGVSVVVRIRGPPPPPPASSFSSFNKLYPPKSQSQPELRRDEFQAERPLLLDERGGPINRDGNNDNSNLSVDSVDTGNGYFYRKQFTLLEMIGAVVGTFTATLALLLLLSRCYILYRSSDNKTKKIYWSGVGHGSAAAYSAAGSHEYDVPRIDHVVYQPAAKMDEIEFLDFKTQRKLYNGAS